MNDVNIYEESAGTRKQLPNFMRYRSELEQSNCKHMLLVACSKRAW